MYYSVMRCPLYKLHRAMTCIAKKMFFFCLDKGDGDILGK